MSFAISPWLVTLLWASFYGSALAVGVLAVQWGLRRHVPARWRFALWLLVMVRFVPVTLPESRMSAFNWLPHQAAVEKAPEVAVPAVDFSLPREVQPEEKFDSPEVIATPAIVVPTVMPTGGPARAKILFFNVLYGLGVVAVFIQLAVATLCLRGIVGRAVVIEDGMLLGLLGSVCRTFGVKGEIPLLATEELASPAVVGFWRPRLLIPAGLVGKLSADEFRMIFLHEAAHIRRRDVLLNYGMALLEMVHWFNPVVWLIVPRMRAEREMACDEMVLMHTSDPAPYGHALLKLIEITGPGRSLAPAVGILETKAFFTRRIQMIARFRRRSAWSMVPVVLACAVAASCVFTGPVSKGQAAAPETAPSTVETSSAARIVTLRTHKADAALELLGQKMKEERTFSAKKMEGNDSGVLLSGTAAQIEKAVKVLSEWDGPLPKAVAGVQKKEMTVRTFGGGSGGTTSTTSVIDEEVAAKLNAPIKEARFNEASLRDVVSWFAESTHLNVHVNWNELKNTLGTEGAPITLNLSNVPAGKVLQFIVNDVMGNGHTAAFMVDGDVVMISSDVEIDKLKNPGKKNGASFSFAAPKGTIIEFAGKPFPIESFVTTDPSNPTAPMKVAGGGGSQEELQGQLVRLEIELARMMTSSNPSPKHSEIVSVQSQIDDARRQLAKYVAADAKYQAETAHGKPASIKIYDVHDLLDVPALQTGVLSAEQQSAMRDLVGSIETTIRDSALNLSAFNGALVVRAPDEVQQQVGDLLRQLEDYHGMRADQIRKLTEEKGK